MKSYKQMTFTCLIVLSTQVFSYVEQKAATSTFSSGTISQTFPANPTTTTSTTATSTSTSTAVKDTGLNVLAVTDGQISSTSSSTTQTVSSTPQFGVRDLKVSADGKCQIGSNSRTWAGSPCAKVYGPTAPVSTSSATGSVFATKGDTNQAVYQADSSLQVLSPQNEINQQFAAPAGMMIDEGTQTYYSEPVPTSTYTSSREAFY